MNDFSTERPLRIGVVSFLNSRPLIAGLPDRADTRLIFDVPARLADRLAAGEVDVALVPIIDVLRSRGRFRVVSDACIGCDGETLTVRVFSQVPPDRVQSLWIDGHSHTSVALATVLWRELYGRRLELRPFDAQTMRIDDCPSVLLIGDKVVNRAREGFAYEIDLGGAWRQQTGLPFVFAVWAEDRAQGGGRRALGESQGRTPSADEMPNAKCQMPKDGAFDADASATAVAELLSAARDSGVADGRAIAEAEAARHGWPVELAIRYLTRSLKYRLDARYVEGANLFGRLCALADLAPSDAAIAWPEELERGTGLPTGLSAGATL